MIRKALFLFTTISIIFIGCSKDDAEPTVPTSPPVVNPPVIDPPPPVIPPSTPPTHLVGPTRTFKTLQDVASQLKPGDIVDVDGDHEYVGGIIFSESGTADKPITIRGVKINGKRPIIKEGPKERIIVIDGSYIVIEGIEVIGKTNETTKAGFGVYGNQLVFRDCIIHDCRNAFLGFGSDTGSILIEYCEIYNCGGEQNPALILHTRYTWLQMK